MARRPMPRWQHHRTPRAPPSHPRGPVAHGSRQLPRARRTGRGDHDNDAVVRGGERPGFVTFGQLDEFPYEFYFP